MHISKILIVLTLSAGFFSLIACSADDAIDTLEGKGINVTTELTAQSEKPQNEEIVPLEGDSIAMRKQKQQTRAFDANQTLYEELHQLDLIPIYLQVKGNSSSKQYLNVVGEGKELTFDYFKDKDLSEQFYIRILPATSGIPYMIYSKKTNTPISLGAYTSNPDVKVVYAKPASNTSTFGASWDIYRGEYSLESFVIENQDYPRQGSSGLWYDIYYSVITANASNVSLEKYTKIPNQEFSIIPVEDFKVESVTFDTNASTLSKNPDIVFEDRFTNNGPIEQNHKFTISDSYKETSSFNKKTSYNVNVSIKTSVKVPFIASGEITTSVSVGQEFTYGESEEHTFAINREYPIVIPANYVAQMTLVLSKYSMDVEYCAICVGQTSGKRIKIRGVWQGVDVQESDAVLKLTPINGTRANSRSIIIKDGMPRNSSGYIIVE